MTNEINKESTLGKHLMYMVIASFAFASSGAIARLLKEDYPSVQLVLFRNIIGITFILYSLNKTKPNQVGGRLWLLIFRGIIGTFALYFFFYGVIKIGLPEAITYQQSYPIFLAAFTAIILGDKLKKLSWLAIFIGFIGLCLIFVPKMNNTSLEIKSHIIGLSNLVMTGLAYLSIRGLSKYYDNRIIVLSFMSCGIILPLISMLIARYYSNPELDFILAEFSPLKNNHILYILALGILSLFGQIYLTKAFSHKETGIIGAMGYSNVVFSIILGVLIGDAMPDFSALVGIILIIISGIIVSVLK
jgi:drug/metabolite transporter (DMT)-like permease